MARSAERVAQLRTAYDGAEVLVAGDSSCLTHVGGILSRQRAGVRTVHLAEILASTEGDVSGSEW